MKLLFFGVYFEIYWVYENKYYLVDNGYIYFDDKVYVYNEI